MKKFLTVFGLIVFMGSASPAMAQVEFPKMPTPPSVAPVLGAQRSSEFGNGPAEGEAPIESISGLIKTVWPGLANSKVSVAPEQPVATTTTTNVRSILPIQTIERVRDAASSANEALAAARLEVEARDARNTQQTISSASAATPSATPEPLLLPLQELKTPATGLRQEPGLSNLASSPQAISPLEIGEVSGDVAIDADIPEVPAGSISEMASSAGPVIQEMGVIAPLDLVADKNMGSGRFDSKRSDLGQPKNFVSGAAREQLMESPVSSPSSLVKGGWYKYMAGALFLTSLGIIAFRVRNREDEYSFVPEKFEEASGASWLPPRMSKAKRRRAGLLPDPLTASSSGWDKFESDTKLEHVINPLLVKRVRLDEGEKTSGYSHSIIQETTAEDLQQPAAPLPFHGDIEKKVRRRPRRDRFMAEDGLRTSSRSRRLRLGDDDYDRIDRMSSDGFSEYEIADELSLPVGTISAVRSIRGGSTANLRLQ
ncbi:MAG: hypothetical protein JKX97_06495 [Candidatus Lindowbacteria bacterium]|nr:hypothetical protein [Candidatus Lindowbacteria bacterium]